MNVRLRQLRPTLVRRALRPAALAVLSLTTLGVVAAATAQTTDAEKRQLQGELEDVDERIDRARSTERNLSAEISARNDAIREKTGRIAELGERAEELRSVADAARERLRIADEELARVERQAELAAEANAIAQERLERRVVEIYRSEQVDLLAVVLGTETLSDLIDAIEFQRDTIERDALLVRQVRKADADLAATRAQARELRANREQRAELARDGATEVRRVRASIASQRQNIVTLRNEGEQALAAIQVERQQFEAEAASLEAESARLAAVIERTREERRAAKEVAERAAREAAERAEQEAGAPLPPADPGDNGANGVVAASESLAWPLRGQLTSPFGIRWGRLHPGIDIVAPAGTPVGAAAGGAVIFAGWFGGYGQLVLVEHPSGIVTAYAHLSTIAVSTDQEVAAGTSVGGVGCTGSCTGAHLHFEVRVGGQPVDPVPYL